MVRTLQDVESGKAVREDCKSHNHSRLIMTGAASAHRSADQRPQGAPAGVSASAGQGVLDMKGYVADARAADKPRCFQLLEADCQSV